LIGQADVVEFHAVGAVRREEPLSDVRGSAGVSRNGYRHEVSQEQRNSSRALGAPAFCSPGAALPGEAGLWTPFPVEYKRGRPKPDHCDEVQLCAQALCLEEMFGIRIDAGALYYGAPRRRQDVAFDEALRRETEALAAHMHELYGIGATPEAVYSAKCEKCSLMDSCVPKAPGGKGAVERYLARAIEEAGE
jgi:CRISPR-associated exonuclease Cas4